MFSAFFCSEETLEDQKGCSIKWKAQGHVFSQEHFGLLVRSLETLPFCCTKTTLLEILTMEILRFFSVPKCYCIRLQQRSKIIYIYKKKRKLEKQMVLNKSSCFAACSQGSFLIWILLTFFFFLKTSNTDLKSCFQILSELTCNCFSRLRGTLNNNQLIWDAHVSTSAVWS